MRDRYLDVSSKTMSLNRRLETLPFREETSQHALDCGITARYTPM